MKKATCVILVLTLCATAYAQIAVERLRRMNAGSEAAATRASMDAEIQKQLLEAKWGPIGPWYADGNWQACTNLMLKLEVGIAKNQKELSLLKTTLAASPTTAGLTRSNQLAFYLSNQSVALKECRTKMDGIKAKYQLQELKSKPQ